MPTSNVPGSTGNASAIELTAALQLTTTHAAERFEQIGALCRSLQLMLKSPQFHDMPWIAQAQLDALIHLADDSASDIDAAASRFVGPRDRPAVRESLAARPLRKHAAQQFSRYIP